MSELVVGEWDLTIKTPVGRLAVVVRLESTPLGLAGTALNGTENVPLQNVTVESESDGSERVRWTQSVRRPLRLNLDFDVSVTGDLLSGVARAGRLPASQVKGRRR